VLSGFKPRLFACTVFLVCGEAAALGAMDSSHDSVRVIRPHLVDPPHRRLAIISQPELKRPRVALVLSGGGARGVAQIGVLKVLEKHGIPVDFIAATSLGAVVGGLYASGYTVAELESLALNTNWDDILSLTEDTRRTELFLDQKLVDDRNFLVVRFEGLQPVIPSAVSTGQRFTTWINRQTLQSLYHPKPSFDDLKIPFRAMATDLVSGRRVVMSEGSLAEALRASATVPLLFSPIEKDSMQLLDGGLVSNIPVDLARESGCDLVIAVNSTSGLRGPDELKAPWQTADQIMGIMMQLSNQQQLEQADIVITPEVGKHLSSDFRGLDTLIAKGALAAEEAIAGIIRLYESKYPENPPELDQTLAGATVEFRGDSIPAGLWSQMVRDAGTPEFSGRDVKRHLRSLFALGYYRDVLAEVHTGSPASRVVYSAVANPVLRDVVFTGCHVISPAILKQEFVELLGIPLDTYRGTSALERVLRVYRSRGYSLARVERTEFEEGSGILTVAINEGVIGKIRVEGGERTDPSFVLREFPLDEGDVFEIDRANSGITNISSTRLFEYVYLEISYASEQPELTIRLRERPSQLIRFGLRADNERNLQGSVDIRDENFQGSGMELGLTLAGGGRNQDAILEYKALRLFDTYLTFSVSAFFKSMDSYLYADDPSPPPDRWNRLRTGEYRDVRYGGKIAFGSQLERLGNARIELIVQNIRVRSLDNTEQLGDRFRLASIRFGTTIDSKDRFPFPTSGLGMDILYEFAIRGLGSERSYNALLAAYETYSTFGGRHTIHPKLTLGFADRTMPFAQQFRLGGYDSFFGTREDDRRGRQMLVINFEYRYRLPFRILFDTYMHLRYDLGTISTEPEELKFKTFRHGIGGEFSLDSPIGPIRFGVGRSFFFNSLQRKPPQYGPTLFYFLFGYQL
jgi:NTE family protein